VKDKNSWMLLLWVAERGHEAVVRLLLNKGADLEAKNKNNRTLLSLAAENGHEAVVRLLLDKGANLEAKENSRTPLSRSAGDPRISSDF